MAQEDAVRWNNRYREAPSDWWQNPRSFLQKHLDLLPRNGLALDIAAGMGQNAGLLLTCGLEVVAVDISIEGILHAKSTYPRLMGVAADLDEFVFPSATFDLILNFYYLSRQLCHDFSRILKPGGLLIFETLASGMKIKRPDIPSDYLLGAGEARQIFANWDILVYEEGWVDSDHNNTKEVASLIAKLPARQPAAIALSSR